MKFQVEKEKFKKLIKSQAKAIGKYGGYSHILSGIRFEIADDVLFMASTDGNRLLETQVQVYEAQGDGHGVYNGFMLGKIQFLNAMGKSDSYVDMLEIELLEDKLTINDLGNDIFYNVPKVEEGGLGYPEYKKLFPEISEEYNTIALNIQFLEELKNLTVNKRTGVVEFFFKKDSPYSAVIAKSGVADIKTRTLIMPIQIRA